LLPNAALRFTPPAATEQRSSRGLVGTLLPHPPRRFTGKQREEPESGRQKRVWILRDDMPEQIVVAVGATDGRWTELREGELENGAPVIVDTTTKRR
jgi:HlyD family secretion protein